MPRKPLGHHETANVNFGRVTRKRCKPSAHHKDCKNENVKRSPDEVSVEDGCAASYYWRARVRIGGDNGRKSVELEATARTQALAKQYLKQKVAAYVDAQSDAPQVANTASASGMTLAAAMDKWLASLRKKGAVRDPSLMRYERIIREVICPVLGAEDVASITRGQVRDFLENIPELDEDTGITTKHSYVSHALTVLKGTFQSSAVEDLVTIDPTAGVKPDEDSPTNRRTAAKPLSISQYGALRRTALAKPNLAPYFVNLMDVMAGTGMRIGEVIALRRENVSTALDSEHPYILIDQHAVVLEGNNIVVVPGLKETKHVPGKGLINTSRIIVTPPASVVKAISAQLDLNPSGKPKDLLFLSRGDKILSPTNVRRTLRALSEQAGLPFNALPHSFRKMVAETIREVSRDRGQDAAEYLGNSHDVLLKYYLKPEVRTTSAANAAIIESALAEAFDEAV